MSENKTVLIVDDDEDVVRGIRMRFHAAGYDTIVAASAESGLQAARDHHPEAILMDLWMKGISGLEAIEELKGDHTTEDIPIVMLSGCVGSQQLALEKGARFFLRKPYSGSDIVTAVDSAIKETTTCTKE